MDFKQVSHFVFDYLIKSGYNTSIATFINVVANIFFASILIWLIDRITRWIIIRFFKVFSTKTKTDFDDYLYQSKFPLYTAHIVPYTLFTYAIPYIFIDVPVFQKVLVKLMDVYMVFLIVCIIRSFINGVKYYLKSKPAYKDKPIDSFVQTFNISLWFIASVFVFSVLTGKSLVTLLTTLGAASAVILFIFKDAILGFVASMQLSINDIVRIGDWITQESYGADGSVIEINLTTVKVRNFDNTITTLPTYSLISNSFKNWRAMEESPGRRFTKKLYLRQGSVRFITKEDIVSLSKIELISSYVTERQIDIDKHNTKHLDNSKIPINGRNQTNLGVFRQYCEFYINQHPQVSQDLTITIRYLPSTPNGLPLQIYAFTKEKRFIEHENIVADIIDHLMAAVSLFDLEIIEQPPRAVAIPVDNK